MNQIISQYMEYCNTTNYLCQSIVEYDSSNSATHVPVILNMMAKRDGNLFTLLQTMIREQSSSAPLQSYATRNSDSQQSVSPPTMQRNILSNGNVAEYASRTVQPTREPATPVNTRVNSSANLTEAVPLDNTTGSTWNRLLSALMTHTGNVQQLNTREQSTRHLRNIARDTFLPIGNILAAQLQNSLNVDSSDSSDGPRGLTEQEIDDHSETAQFDEIVNPLNAECPITHDTFENADIVMILLPCRHIFKKEAIMEWFKQSTKCPSCRNDMQTRNDTNTNSITVHDTHVHDIQIPQVTMHIGFQYTESDSESGDVSE